MGNTKKTVVVGGCFDILHYGHITFLQTAKSQGTELIVLLESDENVRRLKGSGRPIHTQEQRKTMLEALHCVDSVYILPSAVTHETYDTIIKSISPSVIAVTEGDPLLQRKKTQAQSVGASVVVIPKRTTPSTTELIERISKE